MATYLAAPNVTLPFNVQAPPGTTGILQLYPCDMDQTAAVHCAGQSQISSVQLPISSSSNPVWAYFAIDDSYGNTVKNAGGIMLTIADGNGNAVNTGATLSTGSGGIGYIDLSSLIGAVFNSGAGGSGSVTMTWGGDATHNAIAAVTVPLTLIVSNYPTSIQLSLLNSAQSIISGTPTITPGTTIYANALLLASESGNHVAVGNATINFSFVNPSGSVVSSLNISGVTVPSVGSMLGTARVDITNSIVAIGNSGVFGAWKIIAAYAGGAVSTPSGYPGVLMPSASFIHLGTDDPGWYYDNGEFGTMIHGAHGTPYIPGASQRVDFDTEYPTNEYGMASAGEVYGVSYWAVPTSPPSFNNMGDPLNMFGSGYGNTYVDPQVADRSGGVEDSVQHAQNINFYRPNGYPGYQGDPAFNDYGNAYVDTNVADRSGGAIVSLQSEQSPNFYRNDLIQGYNESARYYGPVAPDDVLTNPIYTMFQNSKPGVAQNFGCDLPYGRPSKVTKGY